MFRSDKQSLCEAVPKKKIEVSVREPHAGGDAHISRVENVTFSLDVNMNTVIRDAVYCHHDCFSISTSVHYRI